MEYLSLAEVEAAARRAHAGQVDKAGRPYAEHLAAVAAGVRERGGDQEQIAAAWLHDSIEDDALSAEWLAGAPLSERTKALVLAMTKHPGEDPRDYAARLRAEPGAVQIKQADMEHNSNARRLAALDPATRIRLRRKYARMGRLLRWDPAAPVPRRPCEGDPGDAALLDGLDRDRTDGWETLTAHVEDWQVADDDYTWTENRQQPDGVWQLGYPVYSRRVDSIHSALSSVGAVSPAYHWMAFAPPQLSREETFSPADAVRAATHVVRGERFGDGTIGAALLDGTLFAVAAALVGWYQHGQGQG
ncbi:hypothetical protein ABH941_001983 [Streptacidiphilus sp. EB103A]